MHPLPIPPSPGSLVVTRATKLPDVVQHTCTVWAGGLASTATFLVDPFYGAPNQAELFAHLEKHPDLWRPVRPPSLP